MEDKFYIWIKKQGQILILGLYVKYFAMTFFKVRRVEKILQVILILALVFTKNKHWK